MKTIIGDQAQSRNPLGGTAHSHPETNHKPQKSMEIRYQLRGLNPRAVTDRPMDQQLERLDRLIPISSARVVLELQSNATPAFCASVDLAVPGPDIHAAGRDHTLQAAILKVVQRLEEQIMERQRRQQLRLKRREHCRGVTSQWSR